MSCDRINFTRKTLESLPIPTQGRSIVYDAGGRESVAGLVLQITSAGTRSFQVYKKAGGKPTRVTLGRYPDLTIEQARKAAKQAIAKLAMGTNPNVEKRIEKIKAVTLREAIEQYILARGLKVTTIDDLHRAFHQVIPDWQDKPLNRITPAMVEKRHRDHAARSMARANLAMRYLRAVFNFAMAKYKDDGGDPLIAHNPVKIISELKAWHRVDRRRTYIQPHQLKPWFEAVQALPGADWKDYFQLVLLTGLRREEALGLRWADVDFVGGIITVRDTKNHRDHALPLPPYPLHLLRLRHARRAQRPPERQSAFVFADASGKRISNPRFAKDAIIKASGVSFCTHDLRRTFATLAESLDIPAYALKRLLNHTDNQDVTSGYLVITLDRLREPMARISRAILEAAERPDLIDPDPIR